MAKFGHCSLKWNYSTWAVPIFKRSILPENGYVSYVNGRKTWTFQVHYNHYFDIVSLFLQLHPNDAYILSNGQRRRLIQPVPQVPRWEKWSKNCDGFSSFPMAAYCHHAWKWYSRKINSRVDCTMSRWGEEKDRIYHIPWPIRERISAERKQC